MAVELVLEHGETVEMRTSDNSKFTMRCSKCVEGRPAVDLIPRVRYRLRVRSSGPLSPGPYFFDSGLLLFALDDALLPQDVVAMNLSDKIVRVAAGDDLSLLRAAAPVAPQERATVDVV